MGDSAIVPRERHTEAVLAALAAEPYDPGKHNGLRNPYTGSQVTDESGYNAYMREYVYYRLCDGQAAAERERLTLAHEDELLHTHERYSREMEAMEREHRESLAAARAEWAKRARRLKLLLLAAVAGLVLVGLVYAPLRGVTEYERGQADGYDRGHAEGYEQGDEAGYLRGYREGAAYGREQVRSSGSGSSSGSSSGGSSAQEYVGVYDTAPKSWMRMDRTVYISTSGIIHLTPDCSGMKYYTEMSYAQACARGYDHCDNCF